MNSAVTGKRRRSTSAQPRTSVHAPPSDARTNASSVQTATPPHLSRRASSASGASKRGLTRELKDQLPNCIVEVQLGLRRFSRVRDNGTVAVDAFIDKFAKRLTDALVTDVAIARKMQLAPHPPPSAALSPSQQQRQQKQRPSPTATPSASASRDSAALARTFLNHAAPSVVLSDSTSRPVAVHRSSSVDVDEDHPILPGVEKNGNSAPTDDEATDDDAINAYANGNIDPRLSPPRRPPPPSTNVVPPNRPIARSLVDIDGDASSEEVVLDGGSGVVEVGGRLASSSPFHHPAKRRRAKRKPRRRVIPQDGNDVVADLDVLPVTSLRDDVHISTVISSGYDTVAKFPYDDPNTGPYSTLTTVPPAAVVPYRASLVSKLGNPNDHVSTAMASPANTKSRESPGASRRSWWRASLNRVLVPNRPSPINLQNILSGYISTIAKASLNSLWTADGLRRAYDNCPVNVMGKAYHDVSSALTLIERARHMGPCRARWRGSAVAELMSRRTAKWYALPGVTRGVIRDPSEFDSVGDFTGCEICRGVRPATKKLLLSGRKVDGRVYWPDKMKIDVLSYWHAGNGTYQVNVEVNRAVPEDSDAAGDTPVGFYVDSQCLRQCLVFHRLAHSTAMMAEDVRGVVEDELHEGMVELQVPGEEGRVSTPRLTGLVCDALERKLVESVVGRGEYMQKQVADLASLLELGDQLLSTGEAEVVDSGTAEDSPSSGAMPNIYDAPLYLGDDEERFAPQVKRLLAMTQGILD